MLVELVHGFVEVPLLIIIILVVAGIEKDKIVSVVPFAFSHLHHELVGPLIICLSLALLSLLLGLGVHRHPSEGDHDLLPEVLAKHTLEDLKHVLERGVKTWILAIDSDDKEV